MTDFVLGRIKLTYKGSWSSNTSYLTDDIVRYGGKSYIALTNHTSASGNGFETDNTSGRWNIVASGTEWKSDWQTGTYYKPGDVAKYGGTVYVANTAHLSNADVNFGLEADIDKWQLYAATPNFVGNWSANTRYKINDVFKFGPSLYQVNVAHFSNATTSDDTTTFNTHQNASNIVLYVGGLEFEDSYNNSTEYQTGDVVRYGGYNFIAIDETVGNIPTDTTYWAVLSTGFKHLGSYDASLAYKPGDVVIYGPGSYVARIDTVIGETPSNTTAWALVSEGQRWTGDYDAATAYVKGDLVKYGGYLYAANTDSTGNAPTNNNFFNLQLTGFDWNGIWNSANTYQLGDVVRYSNSSYISVVTDNANVIPLTDNTGTNWNLLAAGDPSSITTTRGDLLVQATSDGVERLPIGPQGSVLTSNGIDVIWEDPNLEGNVFYVTKDGSDSNPGTTVNLAFASIQHAASQATANSTIMVKTGTYEEDLPITVGRRVMIKGDGLRTTKVTPNVGGISNDGITNNENSIMFKVNDGSQIRGITMSGMTGWTANTSNVQNLESTTPTGIFVAFDPSQNVETRSPYIADCTAISSGGIGVYMNGDVHGSGYKSMVFDSFTQVHQDGIGFWVDNGARAEIVSCFTYYATFGYASTGGGIIRSLIGNNSYGHFGLYSSGFDSREDPVLGNVYGDDMGVNFLSGTFIDGDFITGNTSGANATITDVQESSNKLYIKINSGTFLNNEEFISSQGASGNVTSSGNTLGQSGFTLVCSDFTSEPKIGQSLQVEGDPVAYTIQSVGGTFVNLNSILQIVLTQEKGNLSSDGANVTLRTNFSQIRASGHDFLNIGTGNIITSAYPALTPGQALAQGNEVVEDFPGRVFYVSTDQDGNFRVGDYFKVDQLTGRATLNASAFDLSGLTSLRLGSIGAQLGESINEFSSDSSLSGNSNDAVPTEFAVKTYVDGRITSLSNEVFLSEAMNANTDININSSGNITYVNDGDVVYDNIVYNNGRITSFRETSSDTSTSQTINISYDTTGKVLSMVISGAAATYSLSSSAYTSNEGSNVTVTLSTTNVVDGTNVAYTITGVSTADISNANLTGNFTVTAGTAQQVFELAQDSFTEGTENLELALNNGQANVTININDTSLNPTPDYTLTVTNNGASAYTISGTDRNGAVSGDNPTLAYNNADIVAFVVNASGHPFYVKTANSTGTANQANGVINNGADVGTVTWTIPTEYIGQQLHYHCQYHAVMHGLINIT